LEFFISRVNVVFYKKKEVVFYKNVDIVNFSILEGKKSDLANVIDPMWKSLK